MKSISFTQCNVWLSYQVKVIIYRSDSEIVSVDVVNDLPALVGVKQTYWV